MPYLSKEDYEEPVCPLCRPGKIASIPVNRVLDKLDEYLAHKDCEAAQRHLQYWLTEARSGKDVQGELAVLNEQIGLCRKMDRREPGLAAIQEALALSQQWEDSVTRGTTLINAATAYKAFDNAQEALPLYEEAKAIYEANLSPVDSRLGGLYNNMALTVMTLGDYPKARMLFEKALTVMSAQEHGQWEEAITYCNLADLTAAESGMEAGEKRIEEYLDRAEALLIGTESPWDGDYAFVCEKCAPTFGYYGYFVTEKTLQERAASIYERT